MDIRIQLLTIENIWKLNGICYIVSSYVEMKDFVELILLIVNSSAIFPRSIEFVLCTKLFAFSFAC